MSDGAEPVDRLQAAEEAPLKALAAHLCCHRPGNRGNSSAPGRTHLRSMLPSTVLIRRLVGDRGLRPCPDAGADDNRTSVGLKHQIADRDSYLEALAVGLALVLRGR